MSNKTKKKKKIVIPDKVGDQVIAHAIHRKLSNRITRILYHTPITPNQVSWIGFILCAFAALMFAFGNYTWLVIGAFVLELGNIFDMVDGDLARAKKMFSTYGHWLDSTLDAILDFGIIIAVTYSVWRARPEMHVWLLGMFATYFLIEFFIMSRFFILPYDLPHKEFKKSFGKIGKSKFYNLLYYTRQYHINLIAIFAILNQFYILLWCWAIIGNLYWVAYTIWQHKTMRKVFKVKEGKGKNHGN
jgi:hypothetical protein